jgi:hypothetical protein
MRGATQTYRSMTLGTIAEYDSTLILVVFGSVDAPR